MFLGINSRRQPWLPGMFVGPADAALLGERLSGPASPPSHSFSQCHLLGGKKVYSG